MCMPIGQNKLVRNAVQGNIQGANQYLRASNKYAKVIYGSRSEACSMLTRQC